MKQLSVVFLLLTAMAGTARAQRAWKPTTLPSAKPATDTDIETRWYGWQVLAADAATTAAFFSLDLEEKTRNKMLLTCYLLGGPTVHALNASADNAIKSALVRGGIPALTGLTIGFLAQDPWAGLGGVLLGMGVASLWDSIGIAHKEVGRKRSPEKQRPRYLRATPTSGGFIAGLGGTF
jgi:hypothetical protein